MTIKSIDEKSKQIEIDLTGPDGNAFALMATAKQLAKTLNKRRGAPYFDPDAIVKEMQEGDYEHLLGVMEKYFGHIIVMYR